LPQLKTAQKSNRQDHSHFLHSFLHCAWRGGGVGK
jgi:hypothetical protein